ncbi:hypothetical protein MVEN_00466200 [Mycena venus]|uniref:Uncharacterized protein n=1 Tax=Mycena venus TaxID=2733690 RepID=A0A8H6YVC6_9AGAR|nr:hypothetical protein MVEN_00466200 [Mycena venus]
MTHFNADSQAILRAPCKKNYSPAAAIRHKIAVYFSAVLGKPVKDIESQLPENMPCWGKNALQTTRNIKREDLAVGGPAPSKTKKLVCTPTLKQNAKKKTEKKLIPQPDGQAGRADGYNLQKVMGLENDKECYCRLSVPPNTFDTGRLDTVKKILMEKFPFFARFQGGFPIHDLIEKNLQNSVNKLKRDECAEELAHKKDNNDAKNTKPAANQKKNKSSKNFSDSEDDDWSGSEDAEKSGSDSDNEPVQKKTKLQQASAKKTPAKNAKSNPPKRKVRDAEDDEVEPAPKKGNPTVDSVTMLTCGAFI